MWLRRDYQVYDANTPRIRRGTSYDASMSRLIHAKNPAWYALRRQLVMPYDASVPGIRRGTPYDASLPRLTTPACQKSGVVRLTTPAKYHDGKLTTPAAPAGGVSRLNVFPVQCDPFPIDFVSSWTRWCAQERMSTPPGRGLPYNRTRHNTPQIAPGSRSPIFRLETRPFWVV